MKKYLLTTLAIGAISVAGLTGASVIKAQAADGNGFAARFAEKFNLNEDEVSSFMNQMHEERQAQRQANHEERLNQAVTDGVITEAQRDALQAKHEEMRENREENREDHKAEIDAWFEEQGIDHEALMEYLGGPGGPGGPGHQFRGMEK